VSGYRLQALPDGMSITVSAPTLPELFEDAAFAVFDLSYDLSQVPPTYSRPLVAPGDDRRHLLVNWLKELIAESDRSGIAFCSFAVDRLEDGGVQGSASGMPLTETVRRPERVTDVLAADDPVAADQQWSVTFTVVLGRTLRSV
jgi:protein archease